jgi:hypothetical protein
MSCLNDLGWDIQAKYKRLDVDDELPLFTSIKDAECIPEFSNEFIVRYLPMKCNVFDRNLAIHLTEHLCKWLLHRNLTHYKVSLLD